MNPATEDDQVVDLSFNDDDLIDEPPHEEPSFSSFRTEERVIERPRVDSQVIERPGADRQVIERPGADRQVIEQQVVSRQVERPRMEQAAPSYSQAVSGKPCWQCGWIVPPNASFCSHCGAPLVPPQARAPLPAHVAASPAHGTPAPPPVKSHKKSKKPLLFGMVAVITLLALALGMYTQAFGKLSAVILGGRAQQTPSTTSTPNPTTTPLTPTVTVRSTPVVTSRGTSNTLLQLNPGVVQQGESMGVTGSGFDPRTTVELTIKQQATDPGLAAGSFKTDTSGKFYANLTVPQSLLSGTFYVVASESGGQKVSQATGVITGGVPQVKLSAQVGKPGDLITVSASGFSSGENVKVYWDTTVGQPFTTLQADGSGKIGQASLKVPFGSKGINTFLFVGAKTQLMVAATFDLLSLYPSIKLSNYAVRADDQLSFSGSGFGPNEQVLVYLGSMNGQPMSVIQASPHGTFSNAGSMLIPFSLKGKQTLIFLGEQSRSTVSVSWTVQPYMPSAQTSTYGGLPGTTISFYSTGFAHNEIVHVYVGGNQSGGGNLVSCFQTDTKGNAVAAGSYVIPGNAQGKLSFKLVGMKSDGIATASMSISAPPSPVQVPAQAPFTCPLDNATS